MRSNLTTCCFAKRFGSPHQCSERDPMDYVGGHEPPDIRIVDVKNTRWGLVAALILTGMIAALQVGKVAIALPQLQHDFKLSLFVAASAIGAYSVLGATLGMPVGILTTFVSAR